MISDISSCSLAHYEASEEIVLALVPGLKVNKTLTILNLESNGIEDKGANALAEVIELNTGLEFLYLGNILLALIFNA